MQNEPFEIYEGALRAPLERQTCEKRPLVQARRVFCRSEQMRHRSVLKRLKRAPERAPGVRSENQRVQIGLILEK